MNQVSTISLDNLLQILVPTNYLWPHRHDRIFTWPGGFGKVEPNQSIVEELSQVSTIHILRKTFGPQRRF